MKINTKLKKLPLILTLARIAVVPIIMYLIAIETQATNWWACALFLLASITDYLDGFFARRWNATTNLGKFLDPVADKILILSVLIMLIPGDHLGPGYLGSLMVVLLMTRDILIGAIRAAAAAENTIISAAPLGKYKTALQMIGIPAILIGDFTYLPISLISLGLYALWISVVLSTISGLDYLIKYTNS